MQVLRKILQQTWRKKKHDFEQNVKKQKTKDGILSKSNVVHRLESDVRKYETS